jgi:RNA polymerase sigma-70 factor (ECF subfamily)
MTTERTSEPEGAVDPGPGCDPERWVDRHGDALYRYALLRLRDPDLAADAVQEALLDALRTRAAFAGRSSERTWLVGILKHKVVDQVRRASRARAALGGPEPDPPRDEAFTATGFWKIPPAAWRGDPRRDLETREFWDVFGRCLARLPSGLADAFFLREVDGLEPEAVRLALGISPDNLWTRLHRARSLLRGCLERRWFGGSSPQPPRDRG